MSNKFTTLCVAMFSVGCSFAQPVDKTDLREQFKNPPFEFRAIFPFQGAGGANYNESESIQNQLDKIYNQYGFGGILVAPTDDKPFTGKQNSEPGYVQHIGNGLQTKLPVGASPWLMTLPPGVTSYKNNSSSADQQPSKPAPPPAYLSKEYFDQLRTILAYSKGKGRKVVFYDEIGYPSGIANHTTPEKFRRKVLQKNEESVAGPKEIRKTIPENGTLMAVVGMNTSTYERIDLTPQVKNNTLSWKVPSGTWKIMVLNCVTTKIAGGELTTVHQPTI